MIKKLLLIALGAFLFCGGGYLGQATFEPQVIVKTGVVYQVKEVEKEVIKFVEVAWPARHFGSVLELKRWLKPVSIFSGDCDDFALELQRLAREDGYIIDFEVIWPDEYNKLFKEHKLQYGTVHAIGLAVIENKVWYVDPQTKEVVFSYVTLD